MPLVALPHVHGPLPSHMDFAGHASGSGSAAPLFVFAGMAVVDGLALGLLYVRDCAAKRFPPAFWFFIAIALWWLVEAQGSFVAAALHLNAIPWGPINGAFVAAFVFAIALLLIAGLRKGCSS
jgi:hypothetical protein